MDVPDQAHHACGTKQLKRNKRQLDHHVDQQRVPILCMIFLVDFFQCIIIIIGHYGTFVWMHTDVVCCWSFVSIFGETMMFPVFLGQVTFACIVFLISLHPCHLSFTENVCLSVCLLCWINVWCWIFAMFLIIMCMSCISVLYVGTHWFFIFPHFRDIATPWQTPVSVQIRIACLLIQMSLDEVMVICLSLAPYLFCVCMVIFVIMWFPSFGNNTV